MAEMKEAEILRQAYWKAEHVGKELAFLDQFTALLRLDEKQVKYLVDEVLDLIQI